MTSAPPAAPDDAAGADDEAPSGTSPSRPSRSRIAARLRKFGASGNSVALVERLGADRARIVLMGPSGAFGDAVVGSVEAAEEACRQAGITVGTWDRETATKLVISRADRTKMAGTGR
ncbi:MAG: hypothetical protein ACR2P2_22005 [Nakamurella sp.]